MSNPFKLIDSDPRLGKVFQHAVVLWRSYPNEGHRLLAIEGKRTQARQDELWAQGRTTPGKIVTWTRNSKHCTGEAMDIAPVKGGSIPWGRSDLFDLMADCVLKAAKELGVPLRWGGNWDGDDTPHEKGETDSPHFELIGD